MANKYTKLQRSIDHLQSFLEYHFEDFRETYHEIRPGRGYGEDDTSTKIYQMLNDIYNNLYDVHGIAVKCSDKDPSTDIEILRFLYSFRNMLERHEEIFKTLPKDPEKYNSLVVGEGYDVWTKTIHAVQLAIELGEQDSNSTIAKATHDVDFGIITSTVDEESAVAAQLSDSERITETPSDSSIYEKGNFIANGKTKSVILVRSPFKGMTATAVTASKLIVRFRPKYLVMLGTAAGNSELGIKVGDILIAEVSFDYTQVQIVERTDPKDGAMARHIEYGDMSKPYVLDGNLKLAIERCCSDVALLARIKTEYQGGPSPDDELRCRIGKMVSGGSLLRSADAMESIRKANNPGFVGLDMETYSVFYAGLNTLQDGKPRVLSIKSASDFGDKTTHKLSSEDRKRYACYTSARFFFEFSTRMLD